MKDFFKQELAVGDIVAFEAPGYRHLARGKIIAFTPKNVRVEFTNTWNFGIPGHVETFLTAPNTVIKKP